MKSIYTLIFSLLLTFFLAEFPGDEVFANKKSKKVKLQKIPFQPYGPTGCGLGSVILGKNRSLLTQIPAYTTNNSLFANQTFGISSGTSNCNPTRLPIQVVYQQQFLHNNLFAVAKDAARGDGEFLAAYSSYFGCKDEQIIEFKKIMQKDYKHIFSQAGTENILLATHVTLREVEPLAEGCDYVF